MSATSPEPGLSLWLEAQAGPRSAGPGAHDVHSPPEREIPEGQLSFGPQQGVLSEAQPAPQQLLLLPEPPPWEERPGGPGAGSGRFSQKGRNARKHIRAGTTPGQVSLF